MVLASGLTLWILPLLVAATGWGEPEKELTKACHLAASRDEKEYKRTKKVSNKVTRSP